MNKQRAILERLVTVEDNEIIGNTYIEYVSSDFFTDPVYKNTFNSIRKYHSTYGALYGSIDELEMYHKTQSNQTFSNDVAALYNNIRKNPIVWTPFLIEAFQNQVAYMAYNKIDSLIKDAWSKQQVPTARNLLLKQQETVDAILSGKLHIKSDLKTLHNLGTFRDSVMSDGAAIGFEFLKPYREIVTFGEAITVIGASKSLKSIFLMNLAIHFMKLGYTVIYWQTDTNTDLRMRGGLSRILLDKSQDWLLNASAAEIDDEINQRLAEIYDIENGQLFYVDTHNKVSRIKQNIAEALNCKSVEELTTKPSNEINPFVVLTDQTYFCESEFTSRQHSSVKDYINVEKVYRELTAFIKPLKGVMIDAAHIKSDAIEKRNLRLNPAIREVPIYGGGGIHKATSMQLLLERDAKDLKFDTLRVIPRLDRDGKTFTNEFDCNKWRFIPNTLKLEQIPDSEYSDITERRYGGLSLEEANEKSSSDDILKNLLNKKAR